MDIYIRAWFEPWHKCTREEALTFARSLYSRMLTSQKVSAVNKHIRGVQFTEDELEQEQHPAGTK